LTGNKDTGGTDVDGCLPQVLQIRELLDAKQKAALADQTYRQNQPEGSGGGGGGGVEEGENVVLDATDRENVARLFVQQKGHRLSEDELDVVMGNEMGQQLALQLRMLAGDEEEDAPWSEGGEEESEETGSRHQTIRALLAKEGAPEVSDEELDHMLSKCHV
jgi:hypothetical protein